MTDFQTAMAVLGGIMGLFTLAFVVQLRRPVAIAVPAAGSADHRTDRESTDAIGADVLQLKVDVKGTAYRVREVEHSVAQIRTMMNALPSKDSVHKLEVQVTELKGEMKLIAQTTTATGRAVERIENHLITPGPTT